jgi:hypothetical protein
LAKNCQITKPESIHFEFGDFGWEHDILSSVQQKASYLYTAYFDIGRVHDFAKIEYILRKNNIQINKQRCTKEWDGCYVYHVDELGEFLNGMLVEENLLNFLFSPLSFIITGNDNSDL